MNAQDKMTAKERKDIRTLRRLCKKHNLTIVIDKAWETVETRVACPDFYVFGSEQIHEFVDFCYLPWHNDYADLIERIKSSPPEKCMDEDCDWCEDTRAEQLEGKDI